MTLGVWGKLALRDATLRAAPQGEAFFGGKNKTLILSLSKDDGGSAQLSDSIPVVIDGLRKADVPEILIRLLDRRDNWLRFWVARNNISTFRQWAGQRRSSTASRKSVSCWLVAVRKELHMSACSKCWRRLALKST